MTIQSSFLAIALSISPINALGQQRPDSNEQAARQQNDRIGMGFTAQMHQISEARAIAEVNVRRLAKNLKQASSSTTSNCNDEYDGVYGAYNGWVDCVSVAIQMGNMKNLKKDAEYKDVATKANDKETKFVTCAKKAS